MALVTGASTPVHNHLQAAQRCGAPTTDMARQIGETVRRL
jgi:hypothetical protein